MTNRDSHNDTYGHVNGSYGNTFFFTKHLFFHKRQKKCEHVDRSKLSGIIHLNEQFKSDRQNYCLTLKILDIILLLLNTL